MEQPVQAEFNSGLAIIYQLDGIERAMSEATIDEDKQRHYKCLVAYFKTLFPHLKRDYKEKHMEMFKIIRKNYHELQLAMSKPNAKVPTHIIDDFDDWEIMLRVAKQRHGLGMPEKDLRYQPARR